MCEKCDIGLHANCFKGWIRFDFSLLYFCSISRPALRIKIKSNESWAPLEKNRVGPNLIFLPDTGYSAISCKACRIVWPAIRYPAKKSDPAQPYFFSKGAQDSFDLFYPKCKEWCGLKKIESQAPPPWKNNFLHKPFFHYYLKYM